jgi:hypothetical protein
LAGEESLQLLLHSSASHELQRCFGLLKITTLASFPRKRESTDVGLRFGGGDEGADFHSSGGPEARGYSVESHVIPAQAGIQFLPDMDPPLSRG